MFVSILHITLVVSLHGEEFDVNKIFCENKIPPMASVFMKMISSKIPLGLSRFTKPPLKFCQIYTNSLEYIKFTLTSIAI